MALNRKLEASPNVKPGMVLLLMLQNFLSQKLTGWLIEILTMVYYDPYIPG